MHRDGGNVTIDVPLTDRGKLLAMPAQQATARLRNVVTDIEWDE